MKRFIDIHSDKYKNMSIDKKIKVIEAKLKYVINARNMSYRYLTVNKLNEILDNLYEEKNQQLSNNFIENSYVGFQDTRKVNDKIYDDIDVRSEVYKKLSDEEKMNVVTSKITKLFETASDKTIVVIYNGQKKKLNSNKYGEYKDLVEREKKLKYIINKKQISTKHTDKNEISEISFYNRVVKPFFDKIAVNVVKLKKRKKDKSKKNKVRKGPYKGKYLKNKNNVVRNASRFNTNEENKHTTVDADKKRNLKKRFAAGFCALVLVVTGFSLSKCNKNSDGNETSPTVSTSQNDYNSGNNENNQNNENNSDIQDEEDKNNENNSDIKDEEDKNNENNSDIKDEEDKNN